MKKLKGFSFSTKFFTIGIIALAIMAIVNNHVNGLHSLQDLNDEIVDLVRFYFIFCVFLFMFFAIMNDLEKVRDKCSDKKIILLLMFLQDQ